MLDEPQGSGAVSGPHVCVAYMSAVVCFHNVAVSPHQLECDSARDELRSDRAEFLLSAERLSLKAKSIRTSLRHLATVPLLAMPASQNHSFITARFSNGKAKIHSSRELRPKQSPLKKYQGLSLREL